jgi:hypothetical protein
MKRNHSYVLWLLPRLAVLSNGLVAFAPAVSGGKEKIALF